MEKKIFEELRVVEVSVENAKRRLEYLSNYIESLKKKIISDISDIIEKARYTRFNPEFLPDFLEEPYCIIPKRTQGGRVVEWYVIVPRFIDFQLGWLERTTKSYNIFIVNQYVQWFTEIPKELKEKFQLKPLPVKVADGLLLTPEELQEEAWKRYKKYLSRREGKTAIRIKRGNEFQLIAQIIEDGSLPFIPKKVEPQDLREPETNIQLRDYQKEAWKKFLEYGAVGIYWPFGTGKSFLGAYACAAIKGRKLVIVPTRTLKEQWREYLQKYTKIPHEVQIETYRAFDKVKKNKYILTIYDECQHLPANTFIRLATINTKYRMGFSGSPYREDGRVNYIIALTGYPIGLAWEKFFELGIIHKPTVTVIIVSSLKDKLRKLDELLAKETGKTIIFCDSIQLGKKIAKEHGLTFIYGETTRRLEKIRKHEVVVVSRVGDEGMSIPEIDTLIEIDFLYGCYDEKTEVLTSSGWKRFSELTYNDEIATLNGQGYIEYHKPLKIHTYPYNGIMIHFKGKNYDLLVTPNHEMYVHYYKNKIKGFVFRKAEDLAKYGISLRNYELKKDAKWNGESLDFFEIPHKFRRKKAPKTRSNPVRFPIVPFLKFLGWYLSEGSTWGGSIKICQTNADNVIEICRIIEELGLKYYIINSSIMINHRPLARYLKTLGSSAKNKHIPSWLKKLSSSLIRQFLKTLVKGDGVFRSDHLWILYTTSKQLADDAQELAIKAGFATTLSVRNRQIKGTFSKMSYSHTEYCLVMTDKHTTPQMNCQPSFKPYNGYVYCVTVPNHVILVRRNGRAVWCGNSRMQESQRSGRLLHSKKEATNHYILMTEEELEKYSKRLLALYERGYKINFIR